MRAYGAMWERSAELLASAPNVPPEDALAVWEALSTEARATWGVRVGVVKEAPRTEMRVAFLQSGSATDEVFLRAVREIPDASAVQELLPNRPQLFLLREVRDAVQSSRSLNVHHRRCQGSPPEEFLDAVRLLWALERSDEPRMRWGSNGPEAVGCEWTAKVLEEAWPEQLAALPEELFAELLSSRDAELRLSSIRARARVRREREAPSPRGPGSDPGVRG
jgi:hypothetical protein